MKTFWLAGLVGALALVPLAAQDAAADFEALTAGGDSEGPADEAPAPSWGTWKWSGEQEGGWRWGVAGEDGRTGGQVDGSMHAEYKLGDLKVVAGAAVRNNEFVPEETALFFAPGSLRLGVGWQEFSWGVADGRNPTDTLNARDYRTGVDAPRLVNPAATAAWYPADWLSVEAVYEPWKEDTKFPKDFEASVQAGLDQGKQNMIDQGGASAALAAGYFPSATLEATAQDFTQPVYGGRVNLFLPGADLSFSYLADRDSYYTPEMTLTSHSGVWLLDEVNLVRRPVQRFGVNAKSTLGAWGLWFEGAYNTAGDTAGTDVKVRNDSLGWTTGFDVSFGPQGAWYVNLQYAGEYVFHFDDQAATASLSPDPAKATDQAYMTNFDYRSMVQSLGGQTEEFLHTLTANVKVPVADNTLTPTLTGAVMVPTGYDKTDAATGETRTRVVSVFFKPELDVTPFDGVHVVAGADLAYGFIKKSGSSALVLDKTSDKLGSYTGQNNLYFLVRYSWNGTFGN